MHVTPWSFLLAGAATLSVVRPLDPLQGKQTDGEDYQAIIRLPWLRESHSWDTAQKENVQSSISEAHIPLRIAAIFNNFSLRHEWSKHLRLWTAITAVPSTFNTVNEQNNQNRRTH